MRRSSFRLRPEPRPMLALPLLFLCAAAPGAPLRDAGYGDGSLVDTRGNYYYPQPDGSYRDAYGADYSPLGTGLYSDAIGNLIDTGPAVDPADSSVGTQDLTESIDRAPVDTSGLADDQAAPGETIGATDPPESPASGDFGTRYLDDVGDGYLVIDPIETASDPRLAQPLDAADPPKRSPRRRFGSIDPLREFGLEDPPPHTPEHKTLDLSPQNPRTAGPSRRSGPVKDTPQRLRPDN